MGYGCVGFLKTPKTLNDFLQSIQAWAKVLLRCHSVNGINITLTWQAGPQLRYWKEHWPLDTK